MTRGGTNDKINLERLKLKLENEKNSDLSNGVENIKKKISEIKTMSFPRRGDKLAEILLTVKK